MSKTKVLTQEQLLQLFERYLAGASLRALCDEFEVTRSRVYQILRANNIPLRREKNKQRAEFLGVNLSEPVKEALRSEAKRRNISMSELSSDLLRDMLTSCGYEVEAEKVTQ